MLSAFSTVPINGSTALARVSAVARAITGTQRSGPLYFGLRKTGSGG